MFNEFKISIILLFILNTITFAQDPIIQGLDSPDARIRLHTLYKIQDEKLQQYGEALEERMFEQAEPYIIDEYMRTLFAIQYQNNKDIALALIDSANNFPSSEDPIITKVFATYVLCKQFGNFSTIQYVFEVLNSDFPFIMGEAQAVMVMGLEITEHFEDCKNALLNIIENSNDEVSRMVSYTALKNKLGSQSINYLIDGFENDQGHPVRFRCLQHLCDLNYINLNSLLKTRLPLEPYVGLRMDIADTLLLRFGEPWDLKYVKNYIASEPDTSGQNILEFHTNNFIPPVPDSTVSTYQMSVNLLVYNDSLYTYGWTTTQTAYNNHKTKLTAIKAGLTRNPISSSVLTNINSELATIESEYSSGILTKEAYVFLKYHLTYIKDRIT